MFTAVNERRDALKKCLYLSPIDFTEQGVIKGVTQLSTKQMTVGPVTFTRSGNITGIQSMSANSFSLNNIQASGSISSQGPMLVYSGGFVNVTSISSLDADYGNADPYYTRAYPTQMPTEMPTRRYIWVAPDPDFHLSVTQGNVVFEYRLDEGFYSGAELAAALQNDPQNTAQCALTYRYDPVADTFTIGVDDVKGATIEPAGANVDFVGNYQQEFNIATASKLLSFMGLLNAPRQSTNRTLTSVGSTAFTVTSGAPQGFYRGGRTTTNAVDGWSPVEQVWVDPADSSYYSSQVLKTISDDRYAANLGNEQVRFDSLTPTTLMTGSASITTQTVRSVVVNDAVLQTATNTQRRAVLANVGHLTDAGHVLLLSTDLGADPLNPSATGPQPGQASLSLRDRNPKRPNAGPTLALEGSRDNTTSDNPVAYACLKGIPADFDNTVESDAAGGQLLFFTSAGADTGNAAPDANTIVPSPLREALRINEVQQVIVHHPDAMAGLDITQLALLPKLAVHGNTLVDGQLAVTGGVLISSTAVLPSEETVPSSGMRVKGNASVSRDMYVDGNLYGGNVFWSNLTLTGDAVFANSLTLSSGTATFNANVTVTGNLSVTGSSLSATTITANGLITAANGLSVSSGDANIASNLVCSGPLVATGGMTATTLTATNPVTLSNTLTVNGAATFASNLTTTGIFFANGGLSASTVLSRGFFTASNGMSVSGNTVLSGTLSTSGLLTASGGIVTPNLVTTNVVTLANTLTVTGNGITTTKLTASGLITAANGFTVTGGNLVAVDANVTGNLAVVGTANITGNLNVSGNIVSPALSAFPSPVGSIIMFCATSVPSGWLVCDGSAVSRTTYSALFAVIGTAYGAGNGSTTFTLPDFGGRVPVGSKAGTYTLGGTGGTSNVTLSSNNLPTHTHALTLTDPGHSHTVTDSGHTHSDAGHAHSFVYTGSTGSIARLPGSGSSQQFYSGSYTESGITGAGAGSISTASASVSCFSATTGVSISASAVGNGTSFSVQNPYSVVSFLIKT